MVKRRTDSGPVEQKTPKGYASICFTCAEDAGLNDEFNVTVASHTQGTCDVCGKVAQNRMGMERPRYMKLLEDLGMNDGEAANG